jgi:hypothetical protein
VITAPATAGITLNPLTTPSQLLPSFEVMARLIAPTPEAADDAGAGSGRLETVGGLQRLVGLLDRVAGCDFDRP